eukprot:7788809-Karenia_brevis.AAC.1
MEQLSGPFSQAQPLVNVELVRPHTQDWQGTGEGEAAESRDDQQIGNVEEESTIEQAQDEENQDEDQ